MLTPGFVARALPALLSRLSLYPIDPAGPWSVIHMGLRDFAATGGPVRVLHYVIDPIRIALGYGESSRQEPVSTREGPEDGGYQLRTPDGLSLRVWPVGSDIDLNSPFRRGTAARISPLRRACRVLRACGERIGIITNGNALRLIFCDPAGPDSHVGVSLAGRASWASRLDVPESYRLIFALASPKGVAVVGDVFNAARLHQTAVTKTLRSQAKTAIEGFLQCVLEQNQDLTAELDPKVLWRQALIIVYRLLFILKLESSAEPAGGFSFAASETWRRNFSPNRALGPLVRRHLDLRHDTGRMLEDGLRMLFEVCRGGLIHSTLSVAPLGGRLFDPDTTTLLDGLRWGERSVAMLLDCLLWTVSRGRERERVHYGSLDVEELGRVYEALLDLEPDIASSPMVRVRHGRFEAVMPRESAPDGGPGQSIPVGRFFLRTGLGRRSGGSYYTPHEFVRYLVAETLKPLVDKAIDTADPEAILRIKVCDPAMGSPHFLVEACRFLSDGLYEACCRCDMTGDGEVQRRIDRLPDPDCRLSAYLPSRSLDKSAAGPSRARAMSICRRLITVHCLYGIDCDPLAVELAKLSLWLESFAEGMPLTFLDHRLIVGDSIAGPFFRDLARLPVGGGELDPLLASGVTDQLRHVIYRAMTEVRRLECSIGTSIADVIVKQAAKDRLDELLMPVRMLARAWSGAVKTNAREGNDAWLALARAVADTGELPKTLHPHQVALLEQGGIACSMDLAFPEVFRPDEGDGGFHAVLGNPPWDVIHHQTKEFLAGIDPGVMDAPTKRERETVERRLLKDPAIRDEFARYKHMFVERKRLSDRLFPRARSGGAIDLFQIFTERMLDCVASGGATGIVVPSSFHANEGTAELRERFLSETNVEACFSFENRKKLFDIHGRQKFSMIVARRTSPTTSFRCAFYLDSIAQLADPDRIMIYDRGFIAATGGECGTLLELRGQADFRVAKHLFVDRPDMRAWMSERHVTFGREAHMTDDSHRFTPIGSVAAAAAIPLHEGKTFHQYTDRWKALPRYAIRPDAMRDKPNWLRASAYYRLAFREISRSTDERTMIAAIIPPGHIFGHKGTCEKTPWDRPDSAALILCAIFNSFTFDWCVRQKTAASLSLFMLNSCPVPVLSNEAVCFLAHGALQLSCSHAGYGRLWREQSGSSKVPPSLNSGDRTSLRTAVDAVVAHGYGLSRNEYCHVLNSFSHKTQPFLSVRCLEAFDALTASGDAEFYRRYDPLASVGLVEELGQPVNDSPTASATLIPSIPAERMPPA